MSTVLAALHRAATIGADNASLMNSMVFRKETIEDMELRPTGQNT